MPPIGDMAWAASPIFPDGLDTAVEISLSGALGDEEGALPIIPAVDHHEKPPWLDITAKGSFLRFRLAEAEPEDVHGCAKIFQRQQRPGDGCPTVGREDELGLEGFAVLEPDAGYSAALLDKAFNRLFHFQFEARIGGGVVAEEVEEVPLRHHGDEGGRSIEVREVADGPVASRDAELCLVQPVVRPFQELL
jgi:hypothetical protein